MGIQNEDNKVVTGPFRSLSNQNDEGEENIIMWALNGKISYLCFFLEVAQINLIPG